MSDELLVCGLGQLVAQRPEAAAVIERLGLDFLCEGRQTLAAACAKRGLDGSEVAKQINAAKPDPKARQAVLAKVIEHLNTHHHEPERQQLLAMQQSIERLCNECGGQHPELHAIHEAISDFSLSMHAHLRREERELFPLCLRHPPAGDARAIVEALLAEHSQWIDAMERIRMLCRDYTVPPKAPPVWRQAIEAIQRYDRDLHTHVFEENCVLFPLLLG